MPYASVSELPPAVRNALPAGAQKIWMAAHNAAMEQYKGDEKSAAKVAWAAVKNKYKKIGEQWVAKDATDFVDISIEEICDLSDAAGANMRLTADGYLVATPRVARTGIQLYRGAEVDRDDLETVRVYRPPDEVFDRRAMTSLAHRPVTLDHPDEDITAHNWRQHAVGYVAGEVARDGDFIRVPLALMDQNAIDAVRNGHAQISVGYGAKLVWGDGKTDAGEPYDAMQTDIRANHIAIVKSARGGDKLHMGDDETDDLFDREFSTEQRKKMASKGQAMPHGGFPIASEQDLKNAIRAIGRAKNPAAAKTHIKKRARALGLTSLLPKNWGDRDSQEKEIVMAIKTVDGVNIELEDKDAQILERHLADLNKKLKDSETAIDGVNAKLAEFTKSAEAKDGEIAALKNQLSDAELTPQKRDEIANARIDVRDRARAVLGDKLKYEGKDDITLKREVVAARMGEDVAKAMSDEAIGGAFRAYTDTAATADGLQRTANVLAQPTPQATPSDAAYHKYVDRLVNAHKAKSA